MGSPLTPSRQYIERCTMGSMAAKIGTRACVSRETHHGLVRLWDEVQKWNTRINVTSRTEKGAFERHVVDSVQIAALLPATSVRILDIGSGGGMPALPIALVRSVRGVRDRCDLIESNGRKCAFLRVMAGRFDLPISVIHARAEHVAPRGADIVTARAVASLVALMPHLDRHLGRSGVALLHKGADFAYEIEEARREWCFHYDVLPSVTSEVGVVLRVAAVSRRRRG